MGWRQLVARRLEEIDALGRRRSLRTLATSAPTTTLYPTREPLEGPADGRPVVNFASNDYLGLACHPDVVAAARDAAIREGTGAGASRLVTGHRPSHAELEAEIADWKGTGSALVFPTGYATNLGVLTSLGSLAGAGEVLICSDELNHASIIDGARLSRAETAVYRHNDVADLDAVADAAVTAGRPVIVVTDSVFSMDGDVAPLGDLVTWTADRDALLVVDEAHAVFPGTDVGSCGADPSSLDHVLRVGTLSKSLGALGGFVAGDPAIHDLLVNVARPFIFSTGTNPPAAAAAAAALRIARSEEGAELTATLRRHVDRIRPGHDSPIVPVIVGTEQDAVTASDRLLEHGLLVPAIRPPTVAPGTCRLRVTLSATHSDDDVSRLLDALGTLGLDRPERSR